MNGVWCFSFKCFKKFEVVLYVSVIDNEQNLHFDVHRFFLILTHRFKKYSLITDGESSLILVMMELDSLWDPFESEVVINKNEYQKINSWKINDIFKIEENSNNQ